MADLIMATRKSRSRKSGRIPADSKAVFAKQMRERMAQLVEQTRANGEAAKLLAPLLGLDLKKLPEIAQEMRRISDRTLKAKRPRRFRQT
jgi:hypothetical protein